MKEVLLWGAVIGGVYYLYLQDKNGDTKVVKCKEPKKVKEYFDKLIISDMPKDIEFWIAGGSVADAFTQGKVNGDIDMYFPNQENFDKALKYFSEKGEIVYDEENSVKIKTSNFEVDLVKNFSPSKESTVADFDYTVCTGIVDRDGVYFTKEFMYALKNKKLQVNSLCNPIGAVKRIKKYAKRGYDLSNVELQKIVNKIAMTDVNELYASGQKLTGSYGGYKPQPKEEKKPNYALYGGIALAVLVGGYLIAKRK
jgi:hypothetical protein